MPKNDPIITTILNANGKTRGTTKWAPSSAVESPVIRQLYLTTGQHEAIPPGKRIEVTVRVVD